MAPADMPPLKVWTLTSGYYSIRRDTVTGNAATRILSGVGNMAEKAVSSIMDCPVEINSV